jgi:hypothetical protein
MEWISDRKSKRRNIVFRQVFETQQGEFRIQDPETRHMGRGIACTG